MKTFTILFVLFFTLSFQLSAQTTIDTRIPSEAGGTEGIFARITIPQSARFGSSGAPIVIHVAGGWGPGGLTIADNPNWALRGCIEIRFNFPGGGAGSSKSGGTYDDRGQNSIKALRDVVRFALGSIADANGKQLTELTSTVKPMQSNVGMVGWSNGGNATLSTAGAFGSQISALAWIVNWESPVGDGMPTAEAGGFGSTPTMNPAYNPDSGQFDLTTLAYSDTLAVNKQGAPIHGGLYFDFNKNGVPNSGVDYFLSPYIQMIGSASKAFNSTRVTKEAYRRNLLPTSPPAHITSESETNTFWEWRTSEARIRSAVSSLPKLMFIVEASQSDHVQTALDHPHVLIQYDSMLVSGARFVRLNPDRSYVEYVLGRSAPTAMDNPAFTKYDHTSIRTALEPAGAGGVSSDVGVCAAIYELIDRTLNNNITAQLSGVLSSVAGQLPSRVHLDQNFPNPFVTSTTIRLPVTDDGVQTTGNEMPPPESFPRESGVTKFQRKMIALKIFDTFGREVLDLTEEAIHTSEVVVHESQLPYPGMYFYRLTTPAFTATKTMVFMR